MKPEERDMILEMALDNQIVLEPHENRTGEITLDTLRWILNSLVSEDECNDCGRIKCPHWIEYNQTDTESECEHDYGSVKHLVWMCKKCDRVWMGEKKPHV